MQFGCPFIFKARLNFWNANTSISDFSQINDAVIILAFELAQDEIYRQHAN